MAGFYIGNVNLGDVVYSTENESVCVIATSRALAEQILVRQHITPTNLKKVCTLTRASNIVHRNGATVNIMHNGKAYEAYTIFTLGVPKGIDTTKPCRVAYRG